MQVHLVLFLGHQIYPVQYQGQYRGVVGYLLEGYHQVYLVSLVVFIGLALTVSCLDVVADKVLGCGVDSGISSIIDGHKIYPFQFQKPEGQKTG